MRLTTILLLVTFMQVSASTFAQKVTLNHSDSHLKSVLKELKAQTGYNFLYTERQLKNAKPVSIQVRNTELGQVLQQLFADQPLSYELDSRTIVIREKSSPRKAPVTENKIEVPMEEQQPIRGRVVNDKGEPLVGATVYVLDSNGKRTETLTVADKDGNFQLDNVQEGTMLEVVYLGYAAQTVAARTKLGTITLMPFSVTVEDVEVVLNTGYQKISKERATGSFVLLDNQDINLQVGPDILQRLKGISNSVQFDESSTRPPLTVRGLSTINGPASPLIVIDDFPYEGDLSNINPNDIENISILKDAAAASIWGARAGNGVIVITTKRGTAAKTPAILYNSNFTAATKPDIFYYGQISSRDFIEIEKQLFEKGFYTDRETNINRLALSPVVEALILNRDDDGELSDNELKEKLETLANRDVRRDFQDLVYQIGFNQQHSLSVNGGSDRFNYYISGGHDRDIDVLNSRYSRSTVKATNSFKPIQKMEVTTSLSYISSKDRSGNNGYTGVPNQINGRTIYPYTDLNDALDIYRKPFTDTVGGGRLIDWLYYPLLESKEAFETTSLSHILANAGINYQLLKGLGSSIRYQYEKQQRHSENLYTPQSFFARDLVNKFSAVNQANGSVRYVVPMGGIIGNLHNNMVSSNLRAQLDYDYGDDRSQVYILGGGEIREIRQYSNGYRTYGYDPQLLTHGKTDFLNAYTNIITGSREFIPDGTSFSGRTYRYTSLFLNASYTYKDKYTLSGSARKDASNLFGVRSNEKGVPLWSLGGKWDLHRESFFDFQWIDLFALRSSFGHSGNVDQNRSAVTTINYLGPGATFTNFPQATVSQFPNPDLRWEKVSTWNLGIDLSLFKRFLTGSVEYYRKKGADLFGVAANDYTNGIGTVVKNVANMEGQGLDINVNANWLQRKLNWTTSINFNYNTDKVTRYYHNTRLGSFYVNDGELISAIEGSPVYSILSYPFAGLDASDGSPMGFLDGVPSTDYLGILAQLQIEDLAFGGNALPRYFGNILNSFSYKNLTFNFNLSYKLGHYFRRRSIDYYGLFNFGRTHADFYRRWKVPGDELYTNIPSMDLNGSPERSSFYNNSTALVTSASHIRLQFINLSYRIPFRHRDENGRSEIELFANCSNLGLLWRSNKKGIDPDFQLMPAPRHYSFGVRAKL